MINKDVGETNFCLIETEIVKATGVAAVLSVFKTDLIKRKQFNVSENMNLWTALLLYPGTDIAKELSELLSNNEIIKDYEILNVRKCYRETYDYPYMSYMADYCWETRIDKYEYLFICQRTLKSVKRVAVGNVLMGWLKIFLKVIQLPKQTHPAQVQVLVKWKKVMIINT